MAPNSGSGDLPPHVQRLLAAVAGEKAQVICLFGKRVIAILNLDHLSKVSQEGSLVGGLGGARVVIASRKGRGETEALLASAKKARDVLLAGAPLVQLPSRFVSHFCHRLTSVI